MAPNDNARSTDEDRDLAPGRRKAARYVVPVAVAGVAAATIGLVPALAASGDPDLPKITAQELIEKIASSDQEQLSGTVKITTDLGLPSLGGAATGAFAPGGGGGGGGGDDRGSAADPKAKLTQLAAGSHTLRVALDGPEKQRISIMERAAEYSLIHNAGEVWAYDSGSNEAFHAKAPADAAKPDGPAGKPVTPEGLPTTPKALAEQALKAVDPTTSVTVDGTAKVAGRDAYQLLIKPKQAGSTIGSIKVAVDAKNGVPLKFTLSPSGGGKAVIDAGFTKVDFGAPEASTFDFTPPKGTKVTEADEAAKELDKGAPDKGRADLEGLEGFEGLNVIGKGWTSVARLDVPGGEGFTAPKAGEVPPEAEQFLNALGDKATGKFGSGTVFKTRLVNALITDDGKVFVGAVTSDALVDAANAAK
ncbi:outer membrane lipoprotein carrier protein LolA [Streptomyces sp. NPDC050504]|uniref:outer membrane lipoprotein carrier protein LolA n=1 Tax=Streptomyces sp. NPDC050504 TaxID=3365618 RepID=UPI00379B42AD